MRWPWQRRKPLDPELADRIDRLHQRTTEHLREAQQVAGESRHLVEHTASLREWAASVRETNHFIDAYLPRKKKRWKRN